MLGDKRIFVWDVVFLRRIAKHLRSKLIMFILIVLSKYIILRSVSEWYGVYHSFRGSRNGYGRMQFLADDGNGIQNGMKLSFFVPGTSWVYFEVYCWLVVITYPTAVRLEFLICYFRRGCNFRVVWVSFVPGTSRIINICNERRKPNALWRGHLVLLAEVGQW